MRDLLAGGELNYLQDFEAKELAQKLPSEPGEASTAPRGIQDLPELYLQRDLSDGAEGLRRAVDFDVPVVLSRGKDTGVGKLPGDLRDQLPTRITFAYGVKGWNSVVDSIASKSRADRSLL